MICPVSLLLRLEVLELAAYTNVLTQTHESR